MTGFKNVTVPPFAAHEFHDCLEKTPGDEKRAGERERESTRADIDLSFMQINVVWLTHWRPDLVGVHTSVLPEVISLLFTRPSCTFGHLTGLPVRRHWRFTFPLMIPSVCQEVSLHNESFPLGCIVLSFGGNTHLMHEFFLIGTIIRLNLFSASSSHTPTSWCVRWKLKVFLH